MKQAFSLFLALFLLLGMLTGCVPGESPDSETPSTEGSTGVPLEKLSQRVYRSGPFSEGKAVVMLDSSNGRTCVINQAGEILFDLPITLAGPHEVSNAKFVNGLLAILGGICDLSGNMTMPQDVGADKFYTTALAGGYIPALVNADPASGTGAQIGILNAQMEWLVPPSEALYAQLCDEQGNLLLQNDEEVQYEIERNFYFHGYLLIQNMDQWLELSTGNLIPFEETGLEYPSYSWFSTTNNDYLDRAGNVKLDLSDHEYRENWAHIPFRGGLSILLIHDWVNGGSTPYSFALIDEKGELFFDLVTLPCNSEPTFQWDAKHTVVLFSQNDPGRLAQIYDAKGKLIAQLDTSRMTEECSVYGILCTSYDIVYSEGVLLVTGHEPITRTTYTWYFTPELTPLF